ncbi:MAG: HAD family hydrolase [Verrucomicrobiales bacterium]|nr:HAD family hydrolase [Verrucomicrobiales bacterium]
MKVKAVIFDLDGTLLDTLDDLADSGNAVLQAHGHAPHAVDAYRTFIGDGMGKLVERIFSDGAEVDEELQQQRLQDYKEAYLQRWQNKTCVYEGVEDLLSELSQRGVKTGILTNKAHAFAEKCVEKFLGLHPWDVVLGQREGVAKKPDAAGARDALQAMQVTESETIFVGDSSVDMQTAVNAKLKAVGVSWGFRGREELIEHGASVVIDRPDELLELL